MPVFNVGVIVSNHVRKFNGTAHHQATSSVAKSAYRSGHKLYCERTDTVYDYRRKQGIEAEFITLPESYENSRGAETFKDREKLWNNVEMIERNGPKGPRAHQFKNNVTTSREYIIGLPKEFSFDERLAFAKQTARQFANKYNVVVDMALHSPHKKGDRRNYHMHMMVTARTLKHDLQTNLILGARDRRFVERPFFKEFIKEFRKDIADRANEICRKAGYDIVIEHRSFKERGIDRQAQQRRGIAAVNRDRKIALSQILKNQEQEKEFLLKRYDKQKEALAKRHLEQRKLYTKHTHKAHHEKRQKIKEETRRQLKELSSESFLKKGIRFLKGQKQDAQNYNRDKKNAFLKQHYQSMRAIIKDNNLQKTRFEAKILKERQDLKRSYDAKKQSLTKNYDAIQHSALQKEQSNRTRHSEQLIQEKQKWNAIKKRWYEEKRVQDHWKAIFKANDIIHKLERGFKVQFNKNALRKDIQAQRQRDAFAKLPPNMRRHLIKNAPDRRHDQALQRATPRGVMYKPSFMMGMRPKNVLHRPYIRGEQEHHVQHVSKQLRYKNKQITSKGDLQYKFKHFSIR